MSADLLALRAEMTPEQERGYILNTVGPGRYIIVVPKALRDEIMEKHQFKDEDVPGLIVPRFGEIGIFHSVAILQSPLPKHIPPHLQPHPLEDRHRSPAGGELDRWGGPGVLTAPRDPASSVCPES